MNKTIATVLAGVSLLALSACSKTPSVVVAPAATPAVAEAPANTAASAPGALPVVPEAPAVVLPVVTAAEAAPEGLTPNDGAMSDFEWIAVDGVITAQVASWAGDHAAAESLGTSLCSLAHESYTQDEFVQYLSVAIADTFTPEDGGFIAGVIMATMCADELTALGLG